VFKIVQNKETGFLFSRFKKYLQAFAMEIFSEEESMKNMKFIGPSCIYYWY